NSLTASFTDASTDSDGTIASWAWNFGDGTTSTQQNPSHTYVAGGSYNVTLTVTDNGGATNSIVKTVAVSALAITVTPSSSGTGSISPDTPQSVTVGTTATFVLTPNLRYHVRDVTGSCPAGTLNGTSYTTGPIVASCTVVANFEINPPHHLAVGP